MIRKCTLRILLSIATILIQAGCLIEPKDDDGFPEGLVIGLLSQSPSSGTDTLEFKGWIANASAGGGFVPRYTFLSQTGSRLFYTDSVTNGLSVTVLANGILEAQCVTQEPGALTLGVTQNASTIGQLLTLSNSQILALGTTQGTSPGQVVAVGYPVSSGDVIRCQYDGVSAPAGGAGGAPALRSGMRITLR